MSRATISGMGRFTPERTGSSNAATINPALWIATPLRNMRYLHDQRSGQETKGPPVRATPHFQRLAGDLQLDYRVDSISKPQASSNGSGMYLEFLLRRAHSRSRVERRYWSGVSLYSLTTCSNSVTVGIIGPIGSGFPQFGFPRRFAMNKCLVREMNQLSV